MEISCNIAFLLSPNAGALTATTFKVPRNLLITKVVKASPSKSSTIINTGLEVCTVFSKIGKISFMEEIFLSVTKINGFSNSAVIRSASVTI